VQLLEERLKVGSSMLVEAGIGLIQEEQSWGMQYGSCNSKTLLHATRIRPHQPLCMGFQANNLQYCKNPFWELFHPKHASIEGEILNGCQMPIEEGSVA
jgi:hypothetical protein